METIKKYYNKYREVIMYLIYGVLTTIVNFVVYFGLTFLVGTSDGWIGFTFNVVANIIAILFAYVTNRKFVFKSKATTRKEIIKEISSFFSCRIASMIIDSLIYYIGCTLMKIPDFIIKPIAQVVVIVLNYIFSKLIVFKGNKDDK